MRTITKQRLIDIETPLDGLSRFIKQTNDTNEEVNIIDLIGGENTTDDLFWLAGKLGLIGKFPFFAVGCADLVSHLDESGTAKACIEATRTFLNDKTEENKKLMLAASDEADNSISNVIGYKVYALISAVRAVGAAMSATTIQTMDGNIINNTYNAYFHAVNAAKANSYVKAKVAEINMTQEVNKLLIKLFSEEDMCEFENCALCDGEVICQVAYSVSTMVTLKYICGDCKSSKSSVKHIYDALNRDPLIKKWNSKQLEIKGKLK